MNKIIVLDRRYFPIQISSVENFSSKEEKDAFIRGLFYSNKEIENYAYPPIWFIDWELIIDPDKYNNWETWASHPREFHGPPIELDDLKKAVLNDGYSLD